MPKKPMALLVITTVAKKSDASRLASTLIREGLAACVNILSQMESHYTWKGKMQCEGEWLLMIKTTAKTYPVLERRLERIHPYECPEIIAFTIDKLGKAYGDWLFKNVAS